MPKVTGSFTTILTDWAHRNEIHDADLEGRLAMMRDRAWVGADEWRSALERARKLTGDPAVGLRIGAHVNLSHVGVLGYLVLNSLNLADALETYVLSERHFYGVNFADLSPSEEGWTLAWPDKLGDKNGLFVQVAFSVLATFMRQRFPGCVDLHSVAMTGSPQANSDVFEDFFQCPVSFGSTRPSLTFAASGLFTEAMGRLPDEYHAMRQLQIEATSGVVLTSDPVLRRLQIALLDRIPEGKASLSNTAQDLNISARTLQRRLNKHGLAFQGVLDGVREALASRYLTRTSLTLTEISQLVGYSEQSAFNRAFLAWVGKTPGQVRNAPQILIR